MSRHLIRAIVHGSGAQGVIHVGFRSWIVRQATELGCDCTAENVGDTVAVTAVGEALSLKLLMARARNGPGLSRVLSVRILHIEEVPQ